jgi:hypothetical protein
MAPSSSETGGVCTPTLIATSPKTICLALTTILACLGLLAVSASAADAAPTWNVESEAMPTVFQSSDGTGNDAYYITLENIGATSSTSVVTLVDHLPPGVTTSAAPGTQPTEISGQGEGQWSCSGGAGQSVVTCTGPSTVEPLTSLYNNPELYSSKADVARLDIPIQVPAKTVGQLENRVTVEGGGARSATSVSTNPIGSARSTFGAAYTTFHAVDQTGQAMTQAGGHPWALTTAFQFDQALPESAVDVASADTYENAKTEEAKAIVADLPLGLLGDPLATPRCSQRAFSEEAPGIGGGTGTNLSACPSNTRVGVASLQLPGFGSGYQLNNLVPISGHAAEFGFHYEGAPITFFGDVARTSRGYVLRITAPIPQANIHAVNLTFFGDPAAAFETGEPDTAFLTTPADCGATEEARQLQLHFDTWTAPGKGDPFNADFADSNWIAATATLPPVEECRALAFDPSLSFQPASEAEGGTTQADDPSGYNVNLEVPQNEEYSKLATSELKTAKVTLPAGLSVSPSAAGGLEVCGNEQIDLESDEPASCPHGSQLGTVKVTTPLLEETLEGEMFLGAPECGMSGLCTEADGSEGKTFRLFIQVHSEKLSITIKLPGTIKANPSDGQLTVEFAENPQLPFSDLELHFKNGPRAALANPQTCGTFTTLSDLEPWSAPETSTTVSESPFAITGCGSGLPFAPAFAAGTASPAAGAYSPFLVSFSRGDGEQDLSGITVQTPPGLLGKIAGIPRCGEAQANAGTCSPASQIGSATVSAGPGSDPYTITGGSVFLTEGYKGQPFGLSIVVPTTAGPFTLAGNTGRGEQVVRASIAVNPTTAALTIVSDPLPQVIDGVPIRLRMVNVEVNRPGFMLNATNCSGQEITATPTGEHAIGSSEAVKSSTVSSAYAASGCASLPFRPELTASTQGKASKADGASLDVKVTSAGIGQANIAKVDLELPKVLPSRLSTLNKACLEAVFNANPAACDPESVIGTATIHTPILNSPLTGPAYLVSHGGTAFPDVEFVLQGEGIKLILDGKTDIKKGITYSRFESTPDAPFTTFDTELPTGPHSILTANVATKEDYSLCKTSLTMPTIITGQNGAQIKQTTKITVTGCKASKRLTRAQKLKRTLKQCRTKYKHRNKKRASCETRARRTYGSQHRAKRKTSSHSTRRK